MKTISIGKLAIGPEAPPFVIAEMSGNHNQSLERALAIVDAAADAGAHALKIQTYTADTMTLDLAEGDFAISDPKSLWAGRTLYELYQEAHTPWAWHEQIFRRARERGLIAFSTPFDHSSVDFLEQVGVACYKIASFENTDLSLLRKVAATGKPVIMSTGMASLAELAESVDALRSAGCHELILLKCTSTYPASPENSNLRTIPHLRDLFGCQIGLSDHTLGVGVAVGAVALGATVVEKHFTLDRSEGGVDAAFSMEPKEFRVLVDETFRVWQGMGTISYGPTAAEHKSMTFRRSLYVAADIEKGGKVTPENVRALRPGFGLAPKYLDIVMGKTVVRDVRRGERFDWSVIVGGEDDE
jgi:pseudaminic acid synthase